SPDGSQGSVRIHQDALVYAGLFASAESAQLPVGSGRQFYFHVARGAITANDMQLSAGDALQLTDIPMLTLSHGVDAEVLVFDLLR
ncbi:MAG: quercetin 2,3-dioxygenase, partial [Candidatus Obscuribacterales bacterium]|nr:quercetin 2,3-dioxygenase [Steroidobacteraceae bacterium]